MMFWRRRVYAVVFSNYEPAEVNSLWWSKAKAAKRAEELGDMWEVVRWTVE